MFPISHFVIVLNDQSASLTKQWKYKQILQEVNQKKTYKRYSITGFWTD